MSEYRYYGKTAKQYHDALINACKELSEFTGSCPDDRIGDWGGCKRDGCDDDRAACWVSYYLGEE